MAVFPYSDNNDRKECSPASDKPNLNGNVDILLQNHNDDKEEKWNTHAD